MNVEIVNVSRRSFLGQLFSTGALVVAAPLVPTLARSRGMRLDDAKMWQPSVYLGIEPTGNVSIVAHRSEMGTGARTSCQ